MGVCICSGSNFIHDIISIFERNDFKYFLNKKIKDNESKIALSLIDMSDFDLYEANDDLYDECLGYSIEYYIPTIIISKENGLPSPIDLAGYEITEYTISQVLRLLRYKHPKHSLIAYLINWEKQIERADGFNVRCSLRFGMQKTLATWKVY